MRNYVSEYGARVDGSDPDFPGGKAIDAVAGDDGTPVDAVWVNDAWGTMYAVMAEAGLTPDDVPESTLASQVLAGVKAMAQDEADGQVAISGFISDAPKDGTLFARKGGVWLPVGGSERVSIVGPLAVASPSVTDYQISNYDAFTTYEVSATDGVTATITGDTVSADVPAGLTGTYTLTVSVGGVPTDFEIGIV